HYDAASRSTLALHVALPSSNPSKEETAYVEAIMEDVRWLGYDWEDRLYYASDYFEQLYEYAEQLIKKGKAYVCDLSPDEIREYRDRKSTRLNSSHVKISYAV